MKKIMADEMKIINKIMLIKDSKTKMSMTNSKKFKI